jgi:hypothetical protein
MLSSENGSSILDYFQLSPNNFVFRWLGLALCGTLGILVAVMYAFPSNTGDGSPISYVWTMLGYIYPRLKELIAPIQVLMLPSVLMGMAYRKKKFANEGFPDMFSMSMTMFVPSDTDKDGYMLAIRTLKEVPLKEMLFDECAMEVLKEAADRSIRPGTPPTTDVSAFHFVDTKGAPNARAAAAQLRSHCDAEVSSFFGVFQAFAAMRVGPIVSRKFCWVIAYEASSHGPDGPPSFKAVADSLIALLKLSDLKTDGRVATNSVKPAIKVSTPHNTSRRKMKVSTVKHNPNKFRMMLVELECLRCAHYRRHDELSYEMTGLYHKRRWETVRAMRSLFNLETGLPKPASTVLCGSVTFSAPMMVNVTQSWSFAPWESWGSAGSREGD